MVSCQGAVGFTFVGAEVHLHRGIPSGVQDFPGHDADNRHPVLETRRKRADTLTVDAQPARRHVTRRHVTRRGDAGEPTSRIIPSGRRCSKTCSSVNLKDIWSWMTRASERASVIQLQMHLEFDSCNTNWERKGIARSFNCGGASKLIRGNSSVKSRMSRPQKNWRSSSLVCCDPLRRSLPFPFPSLACTSARVT